jgi:hypothetical protein
VITVLAFYQTFVSPVVRLGLPLLAILGLWVGLRRAGLTPPARMTGIVATGLLLVWWLTVDQVCRSGFYASHWNVMRPLCWGVAIAWLVPLTRAERIGPALDAIPPWWFIGLQAYRAGGGLVWLAAWAAGRLPSTFGLAVGIRDVLVGFFAVATAVWVYSGVRGGRIAGIAWNVFGILDFANGFVLASFLPYNLAYPAVMIPAFSAPLSLAVHGLSLRQLARASRQESRPAAVLAY